MKNKNNFENKILNFYKTKPTNYWINQQNRNIFKIFNILKHSVTAYKKFSKQEGINLKAIRNYSDIDKLPAMTKINYFWKYGLQEVAIANHYQSQGLIMTATSGSTGMPTYFPRNSNIDWQYSILAEFFLKNGGAESTLLIDCFGMGVWIGGIITYQAFRTVALRGFPVTVITPGINKKEIINALNNLAPNFKNVIIAGYPPFIKDLLDESVKEKINFTKFHTRLLFAAESFTEQFRDHVCEIAKIKNPLLDTLNIYGSAEMGAMAFETPGSILIRKIALQNEKIFQTLFPLGGIPTLAQYNPNFVLFKENNNRILISANGPVPFLNYDIGDTGGILTLESIISVFNEYGINLAQEAKKHKINLLHLPFVFVDVRSDFATKLYGAIIHPQPITKALQDKKFEKIITQKFSIFTKTNKSHSQFLEINIELKQKQKSTRKIASEIKKNIIDALLKENAEYKNNYNVMRSKVTPVIKLWPYEYPEYFKPGIKQKWVIKQ